MEKINILRKVSGKIIQVDADAMTLETVDGLTRMFRLDPNAEITDEGFHLLPLSGLKNGQYVIVSYASGDDRFLTAKMIRSFTHFN